jgi:hypothetical protein
MTNAETNAKIRWASVKANASLEELKAAAKKCQACVFESHGR